MLSTEKLCAKKLLTQDGLSQIGGLGLEQAYAALQSYALKAAVVGHAIGDEFSRLRARECQSRKYLEVAKKKLANPQDLANEVARLKGELASQKRKFKEQDEFVKKQLEDLASVLR